MTTTFHSVDDVRHRHEGHWFDADTLRFFGSRIGDTLYEGRFFVSSERSGFDYSSPRRYTVRIARDDASVTEAGGFLDYASSAAANRAAQRLAQACREGHVEVRHDPYNERDEPNRRHYAWRPYIVPERGDAVPVDSRNTWFQAHKLKRELLGV